MLDGLWDWITGVLTGILNAVIGGIEQIYDGVLWIIGIFDDVFNIIANGISTVLQFFGDLLTLVINTVTQRVGDIWAVIVMVIETTISFVIDMVLNIIKVIEIVGMVLEVGSAIASLVFDYLGQMIEVVIGIVTGINTAEVIPIPGLPQCITAPLETDWCAIWYITDWTLFAPGTTGAFLIPIIVLIIDLFIIAYVVRSIFKLVRWFQSIYQVT